ncbi:hypothetical protein MMYC01_208315 [Madurella mycetomatis]|uniref:Uncharacterized protein n=1 Tax=Madurella mycetomatis TaxID=100816 RepID=A0A175VTC5_9PEZI|nr:hypothetical protein MMYC01_208315 [Madurella mycetomatis]
MLSSKVARHRIVALLSAERPATPKLACRSLRHPMHHKFQQSRGVAELPGKTNPDNMGGPGGQESFPASSALRKRFEMNTFYGVLCACTVMMIAKLARWNSDPSATYILVHDSTKGELDDVKYIKLPEMPKQSSRSE